MHNTVLCIVAVVGYMVCGMIGARIVFEYYCRYAVPSWHRMPTRSRHKEDRTDVMVTMGLVGVAWPISLLAFIVLGLKSAAIRVLTMHPPKPASKTERLAVVEYHTRELETKTGVVKKELDRSIYGGYLYDRD